MDMKWPNVVWDPEKQQVLITDFDIACRINGEKLPLSGTDGRKKESINVICLLNDGWMLNCVFFFSLLQDIVLQNCGTRRQQMESLICGVWE
jgi:hypothetical protein